MKVCLITPWHVRCGIATYSEDLAQALVEEGCEVYISRLHRFSVKTEQYLNTVAMRRVPKPCDVIHVQHEYGFYFGTMPCMEAMYYPILKTHKLPVVTTMHATGVKVEADEAISEGSDAVIVHNKWMERQFHRPCRVIPHGVQPMRRVGKDVARGMLGLPKDKFVCTMFGYLSSIKGVDVAIQAMRGVEDGYLVVAGGWHTGGDTTYMKKVGTLGNRYLADRITWTGYVSEDRVGVVMGASDVMVDCHMVASESGSILTCLGHGKCVVAPDHPAFKEKEPYVLTYSSVEDLTEVLNALKADPEAVKQQEALAIQYAEENSWRSVAKKHVDLYQEL